MKLQTQIPFRKHTENPIDYQSNLLLLGSCFVENTGKKLSYFKFNTLQNPFGVLFHTKALESLVVKAVQDFRYTEEDLFYHNSQWHCYDAHSKMNHSSKEALISHLNEQLQTVNSFLETASHILITLGTAWVYKNFHTDMAVANCHKMPQHNFNKELLSISDITTSLVTLCTCIKERNSEATVIFTVSPIRHLKDGFQENTRSKAHLIAAVHQVIAHHKAFYFPSYEIMLDELRDYRFYAEDMIHPSATATNYIWEKFQNCWISDGAQSIMKEVDAIQKAMAHKAFNPTAEEHMAFLNQIELRKQALQEKIPFLDFD